MSARQRATITVSPKGQVVLPKETLDYKNGGVGQRLVVEATREGVLLRPEHPFKPIKLEDVYGSLAHHGEKLTDEDIEGRLRAAAKIQYDRD
jgi:bifunctional DNA-binding transcriptional regulator/antitoxin component of YhaV-PrlF toxin-antitoxin module